MTGPVASPRVGNPPPTLAQRAFPRRVRLLLEGILEYASDELERGLAVTLNEQEQQLFKLAEQARSNDVQAQCFEALREIKRGRADITPRFLIGLESALAGIKDATPSAARPAEARFDQLALIEEVELEETVTLNEIASRAEIRNSLPLFLLGQRFGVIAGRPAMDAETLPIGPHALCRVLRQSLACLEMTSEHRQSLYKQFDRQVVSQLGAFYEAINTYLVRQRVLPHLSFVPMRSKRDERKATEAAARADPKLKEGAPVVYGEREKHAAEPSPGPAGSRPFTAWPGMPTGESAAQDTEMFSILRQLLAGRRALVDKLGGRGGGVDPSSLHVASTDQVQKVLGELQTRAPTPLIVDGKPTPRSVQHLKQDLLAQLRQSAPGGKAPALDEEDGDTLDLIGMLFDHIMRDVRPNSPASHLLTKLQVPLVRVALRDKGFFTRQQHPARQMLNAIAETGAYWLGDDEADRGLVGKMQVLVDRVTQEFDGDLRLFDTLLGDLSTHLQTVVRKAEVAERRHVEAARGREKLEISQLHAAETIDALLAGKRVPKFLHTLLSQAWSDVLALTLLRHGDDSPAFKRQAAIAARLIEAAVAQRKTGKPAIADEEVETMRAEIEQALGQVGYHADDAQVISARLLSVAANEEESEPASRTELAMRLKQRTRLGQGAEGGGGERVSRQSLTAEEQARLAQLKQLPFGTWFEFTINQQGDRARRRLSWYSTLTGHCLFVNHRGQRVGEHSLEWLAREVARGNVRVVEAEQGTMIDRAWQSILGALRSFAGRPPQAGEVSAPGAKA